MRNRIWGWIGVLFFAVAFAGESHAGIVIRIEQVAADVVLATTIGGTLDISGFSKFFDGYQFGTIGPNGLAVGEGDVDAYVGEFTSFTYVNSSTSESSATLSTPGPVGFLNSAVTNQDFIGVPDGSVTAGIATIGMTLSNFTGFTLDSLGLTPGVYTVAWSTDSITLNVIGPAAVPEPGTAAIGLVLGGVAMFRRFRKRRVQAWSGVPRWSRLPITR